MSGSACSLNVNGVGKQLEEGRRERSARGGSRSMKRCLIKKINPNSHCCGFVSMSVGVCDCAEYNERE